MAKEPTDRDLLIDALAKAHGWEPPLRGFQSMAIEQIFGREMDAVLDAGFTPSGLRMQYEASQAALRDVMTEHRLLVEAIKKLADEWEGIGFASRPGRAYAEELRQAWDQSGSA